MSFTPTIAGKYLLAIRAVGKAEANGTQLANGTSPWVVRDIVLQVPPPALPHHHSPHTRAPGATAHCLRLSSRACGPPVA